MSVKEWVKSNMQQLNKAALLVAAVQFVLSFFTDRFMFSYVFCDFSTTKNILKSIWAVGVKALFLLLLVALWQWLFWFVKKADRRFVRITLGYFAFMLLLLLLIWPGIWRMDEFGLLSSSAQLMPHFWQNYITSVFYVFSLMLLPFPAGVIIVQCFCIALIVARLVTLAMEALGTGGKLRKSKLYLLLPVPFFMLPVLDSNLYPLRMSLYAFLEVLLVTELFLWNKKHQRGSGWWCRMIVLAAVVTVWRTEAVYYMLLFPLYLLWMGRKKKAGCVPQVIIYLIICVILLVPQKVGERISSGQQYELTSVVLPLVPLVEEAYEQGETELLSIVDKVVNVEVILEGAGEGRSGISLFWGEEDFQRKYDSADFSRFKSAYYTLVMKYPAVFLQERCQTFLASNDLLENTTELFVREDVPNYTAFRSYPLTEPVSDKIRTSVIKLLELRSPEDYKQKLPITDAVYGPIPSMLILLAVCVGLIGKKQWKVLYLIFMILIRVPIVFLTAPSRLFMYYYPVYLFGYCVLFYCIVQKLQGEKGEIKQ